MTTSDWRTGTRFTALAVLGLALAAPAFGQQTMPPERRSRPVTFEKNLGQTDPRVKYLARLGPMMGFVTSNELVLKIVERPPLPRPGDPSARPDPLARLERWQSEAQVSVLRMKLRGGAAEPQVVGLEPTGRKSHYVRKVGPDGTLKDVPHYQAVELKDVYPGVTMRLHGGSGRLEYDFVLAPDVDPGVIDLEFDAPEAWSLEPTGDLSFKTPMGRVLHRAPVAHQERQGRKRPVGVRFVQRGPRSVGFSAQGRDRSTALVIDPVVVYERLWGGSDDEVVWDIQPDIVGNAYAVGRTLSPDYPTTPDAYRSTFAVGFLARLDGAGVITYSTYFPAETQSVAIGRGGAIYLAGSAWSDACSTFQGTAPSEIPASSSPPHRQGLIAKMDPTGTTLVFANCAGGPRDDQFFGMAIDQADNAWAVGYTETAEIPEFCDFRCWDMVIAKFGAGGSFLGQRTIGGQYRSEYAWGVATDPSGNAYVVGPMASEPEEYGLGNSLGTPSGGLGFLAKLAPDLGVLYATKLAGYAFGVAADWSGRAYVTGATYDTVPLPPTPDAFQASMAPLGPDAFFMKVDATGSQIQYATYLGGPWVDGEVTCIDRFDGWDGGYDIAVDSQGNAFIVGATLSPGFPITPGGRG